MVCILTGIWATACVTVPGANVVAAFRNCHGNAGTVTPWYGDQLWVGWGHMHGIPHKKNFVTKGMPHCKSLQSIHTLMYKVRGVSWLSSG